MTRVLLEPARALPALLALALTCAWIPTLAAQRVSDLSSDDRTALERVALAQARTRLQEQVYALPIAEPLTVGVWATRDLARDRALRLWLRSLPRTGAARLYSDQSCDMDVRLDPETLRDELLGPATDTAPASTESADLRRAAEHWPILWASGSATLAAARARRPAGWEDVSTGALEATRRAAEADARHNLLEQAGTLPVSNARRLGEFLESSDTVRDAVLGQIDRAATVQVSFEPDQIAAGEAKISLAELIRILTEVHQKEYRGELFHVTDFREMALLTRASELSATGLAIPPSEKLLAGAPSADRDAPAWAATTLRVVGRYDPKSATNVSPDLRPDAARLDAIDRLRQKVEKLGIPNDQTVATLLQGNAAFKNDLTLFLSGARVVAPARTLDGGVIEIAADLPLRRLWAIVHGAMNPESSDSAAESASQPVPKDIP